MEKAFRIVAFLEGASYILLLFIATPIKHILENDFYVKLLGMPHGILFLIYIFLAFLLKSKLNWSRGGFFIVLLASVVPLGTFYIDNKYFK